MEKVYNEYLLKPDRLDYIALTQISRGFGRFVLKTLPMLNDGSIGINFLLKYLVSDREAALILIDELILRGFTMKAEENYFSWPEEDPASDKNIIRSISKGENFNNIDFEGLGLTNFINRFEVKTDAFFDNISLHSFAHLKKDINLKNLGQAFVENGFDISDYHELTKEPCELMMPETAEGLIIKHPDAFVEEKLAESESAAVLVDGCHTNETVLSDEINGKNEVETQESCSSIEFDFSNQHIAEIFHENYYRIFRNYCTEKGYIKMHDLVGFDFNFLSNVMGIGQNKIECIVARYLEASKSNLSCKQMTIIDPPVDKAPTEREIAEVFKDSKFDLFRQYCLDNQYALMKDLPNDVFEELLKRPGYGNKKVDAARKRFLEIMPPPDIRTIHDDFKQIEIDYAFEPKIVDWLKHTQHIFVIGDLTKISYSDINKKIPGFGETRLRDFLEQLDRCSLPLADYMRVSIDRIKTENARQFEVFSERVFKKKKLEEIGNAFNLERERIRQIEADALSALLNLLLLWEEVLYKKGYFEGRTTVELDESLLGSQENVLIAKHFIKDPDFIQKFRHLGFFPQIDKVVVVTAVDVSKGQTQLMKILESLGDVFNYYDELENIEQLLQESGIDYIDALSFETYIMSQNYKKYKDYYSKSSLKNEGKVQFVLKEDYPDGILKENANQMNEIIAARFGEGIKDSDNIWPTIERTSKAVLWGRSVFIHIDNVSINDQLIMSAKEVVEAKLAENDIVATAKIFEEMEAELREGSNVSNMESLHGVLKYYYNDEYDFQKYNIRHKGNKGINKQGILENLVIANNGKVSMSIVKSSLSAWTDAMIFDAIKLNKNLLRWDNGNSLIHSSTLMITPEFKAEFFQVINKSFRSGYTNSNMIFRNAEELFKLHGVADSDSLFSLAKYLFSDKFFFTRPPHILSRSKSSQFTTVHLIEKLFSDKPIMSYGELKETLVKDYCFSDLVAAMAFAKAQGNLFQLDKDVYCLWSDVTLTQLDMAAVSSYLQEFWAPKSYVVIEDLDVYPEIDTLLNVADFPQPWNGYVIKSIVEKKYQNQFRKLNRKNGDWQYDSTVFVPQGCSINSFVELMLYVLESEYQGEEMTIAQVEKFFVGKKLIYKSIPQEFFESDHVALDNSRIILK